MRVPLAILICFVQLAGPWLCCCGPERVAAAARTPEPTPVPVQDAPKNGGCPHCKHEQPAEQPPAPSEPHKAPTGSDQCPCGGVKLEAPPVLKPDLPTADDLLVVLSAIVVERSVAVPPAAPEVVGLRELPLLTTADRLYAHHVLRC